MKTFFRKLFLTHDEYNMVKYIPIDSNKIRNIIADIQMSIKELEKLRILSLKEFVLDKKNYGLAEHYFRRSLEGILTIGTHILSRLPVKTKDYREIILSLSENKIIPKYFAERNIGLASYRNRLVHMYWEVSEEELYNVINEHIRDLDIFCQYFQKVLQNPKAFGLEMDS